MLAHVGPSKWELIVGLRAQQYPWSPAIFSAKILSLRPTNERRRYKVTPSLIGWAYT